MSLITYLTRIHFADRVLEDALPEELRRLGIRRPLLICDAPGHLGEAPDRVADALSPGMPLRRIDASALAAGPGSGGGDLLQDCDGLIALGGAEAIDRARLTGDGALPLIVAPTTTVTVGIGPPVAVPAGRSTREARLPSVVLCDPTLTLAADAGLTAAAGMDVLSHCIEACLATAFNPPADGIAIEGARRAWTHLDRVVADGADLDARRELLAAALNAGLAAQKGPGGAEAVARALETEAGLGGRHGLLHAAVLPHVLAFNAPAIAERLEVLAQALHLARPADLPAALARLGARIGLPDRLSRAGFAAAALPRVARRAAQDPASRTNPRHATEADYLGVLEAAL